MPKYIFTVEQDDFIRNNYLKMSIKAIGRHFGIDDGTVTRFYRRNGLVVSRELQLQFKINAMTGRTTFTASEDEYIRQEYLNLPIKTLGEKIGRSYTGVMARLKAMGLALPPEILERNRQAGRIKEGNVSFNTGKKQEDYMTPDQIAKTVSTRFKKGNVPVNTKESDGVITIRHKNGDPPYKFIRVSLGKWLLLQRYNWEQVNGPIPAGYCLWCLGDTLDCSPSNWELITRKENYCRNNGNIALTDQAVTRYMATKSKVINKDLQGEFLKHPELIELKRQQLILNRIINGKRSDR